MQRSILLATAVYFAAIGAAMLIAPAAWYQATPGVVATGPYNVHFIRDIALVFLTSGATLAAGTLQSNRGLALAGIAWPCLHALYHVVVWSHRSFPLDQVAAVNLAGIQVPAWAALAAAWRLKPNAKGR